jgi:uncharacterized radical SAM superfamily protein
MAAIEAKFNTITQPSLKIIEYLKMNGYKVSFQDECCIF